MHASQVGSLGHFPDRQQWGLTEIELHDTSNLKKKLTCICVATWEAVQKQADAAKVQGLGRDPWGISPNFQRARTYRVITHNGCLVAIGSPTIKNNVGYANGNRKLGDLDGGTMPVRDRIFAAGA